MRIIAHVLGALLLASLATPGVEAVEIDASLLKRAMHSEEKGRNALAAGNVRKARQHFERSLEILPQLPEGNLGMGHVLMQERNFAGALAAFEKAKKGYALMGDALLSIQHVRHQEAQRKADRLRNEARRLRQIGLSQRRSRSSSRYVAAADRLDQEADRLEAIRPPSAGDLVSAPGEVFFHIGNALLNLGRLGEAIDAWEDCARREPAFPLVHYNLAVGYWKLDRPDIAQKSMQQAELLGFEVHPQFKSDLERSLERIRPRPSAD